MYLTLTMKKINLKKKKMPKTEFQFIDNLQSCTTKDVYDICCPHTDGYF